MITEIPEDAYTFTTEFSFDDSTIDNEELLRLCNFEKGLDLPYPEVRCFAQVCQIGNDIRRTVQCRSLSQSSSTSSTLSDYLKNSKFLTDFSNMNTNSMNTGSNSDKYKCNSGYMYAEYDNDENARMFGFSKMDGCEDAGNQITLSSNSNVPSIDEKCFNGEYVEDNDTSFIASAFTNTSSTTFSSIDGNKGISTTIDKVPSFNNDMDFWDNLSDQEF